MIRFASLLSFLLSAFLLSGQCTLPNADFENTTTNNFGSGPVVHPTSYTPFLSPLLSFFSGGLPGVDSTGDAQSGSLALELFRDSLGGYPIGGDVVAEIPCAGLVSAFNGYYKLSNAAANDTVNLLFFATSYNTVSQQRDTVGFGFANFFTNQRNYSSFTINPIYPSLNVSPDTIFLWALYFPNSPLSSFKLDNLSLSYLPVGLERNSAPNFKFYPNPAKDLLTIESGDFRGEILELVDLQGRILERRQLSNSQEKLDLSKLSKGIYLIKIGEHSEKLLLH